MRCLKVFFVGLIILGLGKCIYPTFQTNTHLVKMAAPDEEQSNFFKFRKTTLDNFNEARRLLASGDIRKLIEFIPGIKNAFNLDLLGPAANMYQFKWSRSLEQIGFEYMKEDSSKRSNSITGSIEYKDHLGFYWMGNVFNLLDSLRGVLPLDKFKEPLKQFMGFLEAFIIAVWLVYSAPKSVPLPDDQYFGPAEALFAERYEIGCFTELLYSVCFLKRLPYSEHYFKVGVACTSCTTHCEFTEELDGTIEEGELCVPPKEVQQNYIAAPNETTTSLSANDPMYLSIIIPLVLIIVYHIRN